MKLKYILGCTMAVSMLSTSCSLEEDPKGRLTQETFFTTQEELDMGLNALYRKVCETQANTLPLMYAVQGDDITTNPGSNKQESADMDAFHPSDGSRGVSWSWNVAFSAIKASNFIINNAEKTPTTQDEINIALGQAKFWRAVNYFYLVRKFGPIPLNLEGDVNYNRTLTSVEDIYKQIEADLKASISLLPTQYSKAPRFLNGTNIFITKQAAQATLVAVYMAMAGWPLNQTAKYADAATMAKSVIDGVNAGSYEYILEPDFKHVYAISHNYTNETVVGISYSGSFRWAEDSQMSKSNVFESLGGWGDAWGEIQFWKDFPAGSRKDAIYNPKILKNNGRKGETDLLDWWELDEKHPMFSIFTVGENGGDYDYTKPSGDFATNSHRHRLIRYSEVLLWYAESQARSEGTPNALAYDCINKVRNRAGLPNLATGLNGNDFAEACVAEHGWEVAGYWAALVTRRDDLMRLNRLEQLFNQRKANTPIQVAPGVTVTEGVTIPANVTWQGEKSIYLPYPAFDAELNKNLTRD